MYFKDKGNPTPTKVNLFLLFLGHIQKIDLIFVNRNTCYKKLLSCLQTFTANRIQWYYKSGLVFACKLTQTDIDTRFPQKIMIIQCIFISLQFHDDICGSKWFYGGFQIGFLVHSIILLSKLNLVFVTICYNSSDVKYVSI